MDKVKWGILRCANIAETEVIPAINKTKNGEFYALASRDKKKLTNVFQNLVGKKLMEIIKNYWKMI